MNGELLREDPDRSRKAVLAGVSATDGTHGGERFRELWADYTALVSEPPHDVRR